MKKIYLLITVLFATFILTGCGGNLGIPNPLSPAADGPMLTQIEQPDKGNALVYIYRPYTKNLKYIQLSESLYVNGVFVTKLSPDGFYPFHVKPGKYKFTLGDPDWDDVDDYNRMIVEVQANTVYKLKAYTHVKTWADNPLGYDAKFDLLGARQLLSSKDLIGTKLTASSSEDKDKLIITKEEYERELAITQKAITQGAGSGTLYAMKNGTLKHTGNGNVGLDKSKMASSAITGVGVSVFMENIVKGKSSNYKGLVYKGINGYDMSSKYSTYKVDKERESKFINKKQATIYLIYDPEVDEGLKNWHLTAYYSQYEVHNQKLFTFTYGEKRSFPVWANEEVSLMAQTNSYKTKFIPEEGKDYCFKYNYHEGFFKSYSYFKQTTMEECDQIQ